MAGQRRSKQDRAADLNAKAMWATAEAEAQLRPEVAVALKCVRGIDKLGGSEMSDAANEALDILREVAAKTLKAIGVPVPG